MKKGQKVFDNKGNEYVFQSNDGKYSSWVKDKEGNLISVSNNLVMDETSYSEFLEKRKTAQERAEITNPLVDQFVVTANRFLDVHGILDMVSFRSDISYDGFTKIVKADSSGMAEYGIYGTITAIVSPEVSGYFILLEEWHPNIPGHILRRFRLLDYKIERYAKEFNDAKEFLQTLKDELSSRRANIGRFYQQLSDGYFNL